MNFRGNFDGFVNMIQIISLKRPIILRYSWTQRLNGKKDVLWSTDPKSAKVTSLGWQEFEQRIQNLPSQMY